MPASSGSSASCRTPGWTSSRSLDRGPARGIPGGACATYGAMMIVHAEDSDSDLRGPPSRSAGSTPNFLASRPRGAENVAIAHVIEAARHTEARVHLLHLSSSDAVPMIRTARRDGVDDHRGDVPALPRSSRPSRSPTAPRSSSAARRSGKLTTGRSCGGRWAAATSTASSPTIPHAPWSSSASRSASSVRPGAASRRCRSRPCPPFGPRRGCAGTHSSTSCGGWPSAPPRSPGCREGPHRAWLPRRLHRLRTRRRLRRRPESAAPPQPHHSVRLPRAGWRGP